MSVPMMKRVFSWFVEQQNLGAFEDAHVHLLLSLSKYELKSKVAKSPSKTLNQPNTKVFYSTFIDGLKQYIVYMIEYITGFISINQVTLQNSSLYFL